MHEYLRFTLDSASDRISLSRYIHLRGPLEVGLLEIILPPQMVVIDESDTVTTLISNQLQPMSRKWIQFQPGKTKTSVIRNALKYWKNIAIQFKHNHFEISLPPGHAMRLPEPLARSLGMPTLLYGRVEGRSGTPNRATEKLGQYLEIISVVAREHSIPVGDYQNAALIREAFSKQGIELTDNAEVVPKPLFLKTIVSLSLIEKLQCFTCIMLMTDMVEPSVVGDRLLPLLKWWPSHERFNVSRTPHYKKVRMRGQLASCHFQLVNECGHPLHFSGKIHLTLDVRDASD